MSDPKQIIPSRVHADDFTADVASVNRPDCITATSRNPIDADVVAVDVPLAHAAPSFGTPSVLADARTVLPGQPVRYHGGICIGTPIEVQADPSKIVGVVTGERQPEPDHPAIPEPGFYWARLQRWGFEPGEWTVVEVTDPKVTECERPEVWGLGQEIEVTVIEWGPKLEPPR